VSVDEAYVDLAAGDHDLSVAGVTALATRLKETIAAATGGVTGSVGVGTSKSVAKIGSELDKPDGLTVVPAGQELAVLHPLPVRSLGGVGPATAERLAQVKVKTVGDLHRLSLIDLTSLVGQAHGTGLYRLARADDDRPVVTDREAKSVSAEETFARDLTDPTRLSAEIDALARRVGSRLQRSGTSGRTVTLKVRRYDFTTLTRSQTLAQPVDDPRQIADVARRLLGAVDRSGGLRLLGVGVSGLSTYVQGDLFAEPEDPVDDEAPVAAAPPEAVPGDPRPGPAVVAWHPGQDVAHPELGSGWVWGSGLNRVTVRFEGPRTPPGPVRTLAADDPDLQPADPPDWT
jgi:DNA polymerase IV